MSGGALLLVGNEGKEKREGVGSKRGETIGVWQTNARARFDNRQDHYANQLQKEGTKEEVNGKEGSKIAGSVALGRTKKQNPWPSTTNRTTRIHARHESTGRGKGLTKGTKGEGPPK